MEIKIIDTRNIAEALKPVVAGLNPDRIFTLTDSNVAEKCHAVLDSLPGEKIIIPAGEEQKSIEYAQKIWKRLIEGGATRSSLLINLGGGVITDLGGFCAATFKRGIRFINIPTTLLAMSDAAIGGKTGIDFMGLKNEIGAFRTAEAVIISPETIPTLPGDQIVSGFAEIVKTALIADANLYDSIVNALDSDSLFNLTEMLSDAAAKSARIKQQVVTEDPYDQGLRHILNFGHTAGHAFESMRLEQGRPVSHGAAVAWGMTVALRLSGLDEVEKSYRENIYDKYYEPVELSDSEKTRIIELMSHDKKNQRVGEIRFILLKNIGQPYETVINFTPDLL